VEQLEQSGTAEVVPVKCLKINAQTQGGTVERENMGGSASTSNESLLADLQQWHRVQGHSERTVRAAKQRFIPFWHFLEKQGLVSQGRIELESITANILADYQTSLFDGLNGKKIAPLTQTNYLCFVQSLFRFLHKTKRLAHDPSRIIKLPHAEVTIPSAILTTREVKKLLSMPDVHTVLGFRDRAILEVFWSTGIRMNELITLNVEDVRFDEGLLFIRQGKGHGPTGKQRLIPLGASALAWLRRYIDTVRPLLTREALPHRRWKPEKISPRLFLSQTGQEMEDTSVGHRLRMYQKQARIKKRITGHVFRHTLATEMLKAGADLRHIQEMLGHEQLNTTQRYLRVVREELKKVHHATHPREQMPVAPVHYRGTL